jgi:hypothetical protein
MVAVLHDVIESHVTGSRLNLAPFEDIDFSLLGKTNKLGDYQERDPIDVILNDDTSNANIA